MKLSEIKNQLSTLEKVVFTLPSGEKVPAHFHVTEVGIITKDFIDCGGTVRHEKVANFQLWEADDYDHRLGAQKLLGIIGLSEKVLGMEDLEVEVEYQSTTIGKYGIEFQDGEFHLINKQTDCLAKDKCGIPAEKPRIRISTKPTGGCEPNSGCC